jgi:hypothetical protein
LDIKIVIERLRELNGARQPAPSSQDANTELRFRVWFEGEEIGIWRDPGHSAARWLVDRGKAKREDALRIVHNGAPALRGSVAWFADHQVRDDDKTGLRVVKWMPSPFATQPRPGEGAASDGPGATQVAKT